MLQAIVVNFPMNDEQSSFVSQFNNEIKVGRAERAETTRRLNHLCLSFTDIELASFFSQFISEALFDDKSIKQTAKRRFCKAIENRNDKKGLVWDKDNATIRPLKANESFNKRGEVKVQKDTDTDTDDTDDTDTEQNLQTSIAKQQKTIEEKDEEIRGLTNQLSSIDQERFTTENELQAKIEQAEKEQITTEGNFRALLTALHSKKYTLKQLRENFPMTMVG